jgi:predicted DsbA family dithiol-disulfide isomerase
MPAKQIKLKVVSDLTCPWCYIGQRELLDAVDEVTKTHSNISFEIEYRPFRLNPSFKDDEPVDKMPWFFNKFGEEKARALLARVDNRAKECNIEIKIGGKLCSTTRAHRLLLKAWKVGGQSTQQTVLDAIFKAYFGELLDISNVDILATVAQDAGLMDKQEALEYLKSDEDLKEVDDLVEEARAGGVSGVPVTVIDDKWAISGGQSKDVYLQIFKKLATCCGSSRGPGNVQMDANASCSITPPEDSNACVATTA